MLYVWMGGGLFCTSQTFVCKSNWKLNCNDNNVRVAGSTAIRQILMSDVLAEEKLRENHLMESTLTGSQASHKPDNISVSAKCRLSRFTGLLCLKKKHINKQ